jgi:hypothetical protein
VAVRDDEQLAPNMPILSVLSLYMAMRSRIEADWVGMTASLLSLDGPWNGGLRPQTILGRFRPRR